MKQKQVIGEKSMDEGPFRMSPRPTDRRAAVRPEPVKPRQDAPRPVNTASQPNASVSTPTRQVAENKSSKKRLLPLWIAIGIILLLAAGVMTWMQLRTPAATAIDTSKYQAVFFTNGQVYFGKLQSFNGDYLQLTDIYYLQSQQNTVTDDKDSKNPQQTSADDGNVQLIKLGDEIHGPEDQMMIAKDQVLFYENLKPTGKVAKSIEQFKKQ